MTNCIPSITIETEYSKHGLFCRNLKVTLVHRVQTKFEVEALITPESYCGLSVGLNFEIA